jgi:hypothetical protein
MNLDYPATRITVSRDTAPQDVTVRLQFEKPIDDPTAAYWVSILEQISIVTNAGGLAGSSIPPWESMMVPKNAQRIGHDGLAVDFTVHRVDFGFFRVLHNCLVSAHVYNARLLSLDVQTSSAKDLAVMSTAEIGKVPYPVAPQTVPFTLDRPPPSPVEESVAILIDVPTATEEQAAPLAVALTAWGELLLGAYPEDGEHPFSCVSDCQSAEWTGDAISFLLPTYMGSESAFDAVVSMACRAVHGGLAITQVSIE